MFAGIHDQFGGLLLIDAAHFKGLAVILDMVYNHASINDNHSRRYDGNDGAYNRDRNGNFLVLVSHS